MSPENEDEVAETTELIDPIGHARVVYLGPVAPTGTYSPTSGRPRWSTPFVSASWPAWCCSLRTTRSSAATVERVVRDAERENLALEWDLGIPEDAAE